MHLKLAALALVALLGSLGVAKDDNAGYEHAMDIEVGNAELGKYGDDATLSCQVDGVTKTAPLIWNKEGVRILPDPEKYVLSSANGTLTVLGVLPDDIGEYECVIELSDVQTYNKTVNLFAPPFVYGFDKSKNLVQGDPLVLDCKAYGHPTPSVQWMKDEGEGEHLLDITDERISLKPNADGLENGTLRIENLDFDDRADYICFATNPYGSRNSTILVRVKDKLAALWPFLGICAEVAILVVIIFIYERKRAKKLEEMEAKEEADHLTNSHSHKGADDVRQRK